MHKDQASAGCNVEHSAAPASLVLHLWLHESIKQGNVIR